MVAMQGGFDASQFSPEQGMAKHPTGKFPAVISETSIEENKNKDGGYFSVTFTTPAGQIVKNYNLWSQSTETGKTQMMEIAQKNFAALCYATGVMRVEWSNEGAAMRNARCMIEVTPQVKNDKFNEVSKVYDANGNEPGKAPPAQGFAAPQQPANAPPQNGGWNNSPQPAAQPAPQPQQGWAPPAQNNAPANNPAPANTAAAWQQGQSAPVGGAPAWATNK